jgi:putative transcriptional regulator
MARKAFDKIKAGLDDALAYAAGDISRATVHQVEIREVDVAALRKRLGLSQQRFAVTFGFSAKTVRNWEQGLRHPEGPARILLQVIEREPEAVLRALRAA